MIIFMAGIYTSSFNIDGRVYNRLTDNEKKVRKSVPSYLESYHYVKGQSYVDKMRTDKIKVFLDSGAFSAWSKGAEVDLPGYCDYIKRNSDIIRVEDDMQMASVLDSIGDAEGTYENQRRMEALGVRPLPCFHYGEDPRYLEYYAANYSYITLGGMVAQSTKDLKIWLDEVWGKYLTDGAGRPKTKVHGFGVTTPTLMKRYPWFSVDSSTWVQYAKNGNLVYDKMKALPVSVESPTRKKMNQHYDTFSEPIRQAVRKRVEEQGFEMDRLQTEYVSRWVYNLKFYIDEHENYPDYNNVTFFNDQMGLF